MLTPTKSAFFYAFIIAFGGLVFGLDLVLISGTNWVNFYQPSLR